MSILVDFEDIYTAICEELKVPLTDTTTLGRIKRDINMIYQNHVIPYKPRAWWWLEKKENIVTYEKIDAGTVSVTADSTTVTFSSAPTVSVAGYYIKLTGYPEIVKISAHTASATTATLETAWMLETASGQSYKCWKDFAPLTATMKDIILVTHDRLSSPLDAMANVEFTEARQRHPHYEGYPIMYNTGDFDTDGNRIIRWYPACSDTRYQIKIEGRQEAPALSLDADEPLMPVEDRIVIFYGACSRAWSRERNDTEAGKNWTLFMGKLNEMAAKSGDAPQVVEMQTDKYYMRRKRYRRYGTSKGRRFESD